MVIFKKAFPTDPRSLLSAFAPQQAACRFLNRLLQQQPAVLDLLSRHAGQSFELNAPPLSAWLTIEHDGALSPADKSIAPNVKLSIDTHALLERGWRPGQPLPQESGYVHISGDAALAQTLSMLAECWRPDAEDLLADYVGDIAARQLFAGAARLQHLFRQGLVRASENVAEYAAHEADLLVSLGLAQEHWARQAHLIAHLDGIEKRLAQIDRRIEASHRHGQRSGS